MDRELVWTARASDDIAAIIRYIAQDDPAAAARVGFGIYERAQILLQHPEAGSRLEDLPAGGWRKLTFRRGKLIYAIRAEKIVIGRIWPAALGEADLETPL